MPSISVASSPQTSFPWRKCSRRLCHSHRVLESSPQPSKQDPASSYIPSLVPVADVLLLSGFAPLWSASSSPPQANRRFPLYLLTRTGKRSLQVTFLIVSRLYPWSGSFLKLSGAYECIDAEASSNLLQENQGSDLGWLPAFPHVLTASMANFLFGYHIG